MDVEGADGNAATAAAAAAAAPAAVEVVEGKKVRGAWQVVMGCVHYVAVSVGAD